MSRWGCLVEISGESRGLEPWAAAMENRKEFVWFPAEESEWVLCQKLSRTDSTQLFLHCKWQSSEFAPCRTPAGGATLRLGKKAHAGMEQNRVQHSKFSSRRVWQLQSGAIFSGVRGITGRAAIGAAATRASGTELCFAGEGWARRWSGRRVWS